MFKESTDLENVSKKEPTLDTLIFVRLKIPRLIPIELIENVKGRTFTPEQFYIFQEAAIDNPYNHLFVLCDIDRKIHGFLWCEVNVMDGTLFVNTFSISKEFWGKGKSLEKVIPFLEGLKLKCKSPRVYWCTTNEKFFVKHGFKRSRMCLMEYNEEKKVGQ